MLTMPVVVWQAPAGFHSKHVARPFIEVTYPRKTKPVGRFMMAYDPQVVRESNVAHRYDSQGMHVVILAPKVVWTGASRDETLIEEARTMQFSSPPPGAFASLEWTSALKAVAGDTVLDGDPEHAGLHFLPTDANAHKDRDYPWGGTTYSTIRARFLAYQGALPSAETIQKLWNDYVGKKDPLVGSTRKPAGQ